VSIKLVDNNNLPGPFARVVENDPYDDGGADFTPSSLLRTSRAYALLKLHDNVEVELIKKFISTWGQNNHSFLERGGRPGIDLVEKRFFTTFVVEGIEYKLAAQIDIYESDTKILWDYKGTKAWAFIERNGGGVKDDYTAQMNMQKWIMARQPEPIEVTSLRIIGLLRDWTKHGLDPRMKKFFVKGYPKLPVVSAEQPMWTNEQTEAWITERIRGHVAALKTLPQCKPSEIWRGDKCKDWCDAASVCDQFKEMMKTGITQKEEE
jgi:hypothetical protein